MPNNYSPTGFSRAHGGSSDPPDAVVSSDDGTSKTFRVDIADADGDAAFDGPMAKASDPQQLGAPMPGQVEKIAVKEGQKVAEGDVLLTVSAMKMEVHVKAPFAGTVSKIQVEVGAKVIEGALVAVLKKE